MLLYRISKQTYAGDTEGIGSKLYGGRWNNAGIPCIYTSESRALAILEYAVNIELTMIPEKLAITIYEAPEDTFLNCTLNNLPPDWKDSPSPSSTKEYGSKIFLNISYLGIKVPSAIVQDEFNYLINPLSSKLTLLNIIDVQDFIFDQRIKK
ncbi:MAG: RES family NAD+ phosphorylase [Daejeonella sp.]